MAEVGEGNLEWPAIIAACGRDPFESLKISLENLKAMGLE